MKTTTNPEDGIILRIIIWASSLAMGVGAASLEALRPHCTFEFSATTPVAFAVGMAGLWSYWMLIFNPRTGALWRRLRVMATALVALAGFTGFLYPVRFIAPEKYPELAIGLAAAVTALSVLTTLLLGCKRLFEEENAA